jgi:hypothetical protein
MYKYRARFGRIVLGDPLPKEMPLPKPAPKNIMAEALKVREFFDEDATRNFHHASRRFKVTKARICQLMKIIDVLPEDFVDYMGRRQDQAKRISGKALRRIAGLGSTR